MLEVHALVEDGVVSHFPYEFLRDNCLCPLCFHAESSSRLTSFSTLDVDETVVTAEPIVASTQDTRLGKRAAVAEAEQAQQCVKLTWSSGHESVFRYEWLRERCFSDVARSQRAVDMDLFSLVESTGLAAEAGWHAEVEEASSPVGPGRRERQASLLPRFDLAELESSPRSMLGWCHAMEKFGVAMVRTPNHNSVLKRFTDLFGFREWCSYGEYYVVENKQSSTDDGDAANNVAGQPERQANNLAYTGLPLAFHTDLPHYSSPPQVQLLHCISQTSCPGGFNKLVDGFAVAEQLRSEAPEAFELLATIRMEYKDFHHETLWDSGPGGDDASDRSIFGGRAPETPRLGERREVGFFLRYAHPVISVEDPNEWRTSRVTRINFSDRARQHPRASNVPATRAAPSDPHTHRVSLLSLMLDTPRESRSSASS